ncbi:13796_t:CDS:2, partial [Rhizophagus irregularis]
YTSKELEFDIDIERANVLVTKRNIEELNINSHENNGKHIKIE